MMTRDEVLAIVAAAREKNERVDLCEANLSGVDLSGVDLSEVDLSEADLSGANLIGADLSNLWLERANLSRADMTMADLSNTSLFGAVMCEVNLSGANLYNTNLKETDLYKANLFGANLLDANLRKASLKEADLCSADLRNAILCETNLSNIITDYLTIGIHPAPEGRLVGWGTKSRHMVKMEIPEDSPRSCATTRKFRCYFADVIEIDGGNTTWIDHVRWVNRRKIVTRYEVGKRVYADSWDEDRWKECSHGIHFFLSRNEAERWSG